MTLDDLPRLYTLEEVSELTGFALRTLQRDCRANKIAHVRKGRERRMTADQINALISKYTVVPEPNANDIAKAASRAAAQERLDKMLADAATRRSSRRP